MSGVRELAVYREGRLVLVARAEPGTLRSSAGPPPGVPGPPGPPGPPGSDPGLPPGVHPFIDAQASDPVTEGRLRALLDESSDYDDYLARLVAAGFDVAAPGEDGAVHELPRGARLYDGDALVGAVWPRAGRFTSLRGQPEYASAAGTLTAYDEDWAPRLLDALRGASDHDDLAGRLREAGLRVG